MYHEVIHAYLNYERTRLEKIEFNSKYPSVIEHILPYGSKYKVKNYQFIQTGNHNQFHTFMEKLVNSILSFNPNIPLGTARAMAKVGIVEDKELSHIEKELNEKQRKGIDPKGTKCN